LIFKLFENLDCLNLTRCPIFADHKRRDFSTDLDSTASESHIKALSPNLPKWTEEPLWKQGTIKIHPEIKAIDKAVWVNGMDQCDLSYAKEAMQLLWTII